MRIPRFSARFHLDESAYGQLGRDRVKQLNDLGQDLLADVDRYDTLDITYTPGEKRVTISGKSRLLSGAPQTIHEVLQEKTETRKHPLSYLPDYNQTVPLETPEDFLKRAFKKAKTFAEDLDIE